jgi:acetyltransferase-like isoleucine patch superfamily enzyme
VIRDNVVIGRDCYIGALCAFEGQTIVGDNTCIEAQCYIAQFSRIGKNVFIAPFFLSSNDSKISYHRRVKKNLLGVIVEDNVRIAGNVMTFPGVTIGEGAIVGAYSLVTKNVRPHTLVYGIPAREHADKSGLLRQELLPQFKQRALSNSVRRSG